MWCKDALHSLGYATETALLMTAIKQGEAGDDELANKTISTVEALTKLDSVRAALLCDPKLNFE